MLRSLSVRLGGKSLGAPGKTLVSAIQASRTVSRYLGGSKARGAPLDALNAAVTKSNGKSLASAAAHIARATALLNRPLALDSLNSVLEDVSAALASTQSAPAASVEAKLLHRLALAIRLRALNNLLDEKEHLMTVSGAANESDVSTARSQVQQAYEALIAVNPSDPFVLLGYAEFQLYQGNAEAALTTAAKAEKLFAEEAQRLSTLKRVDDVATTANTTAASIVAFKVTTSLPPVDTSNVKNTIIQDTLTQLSQRPNVTEEELAALRVQLDAPETLTRDELLCLASALDNAEKGQNFMDFFPLTETYVAWESEASKDVSHAVESFMFGKGVNLAEEDLVQLKTKPAATFYASTTELKKILASDSKADFLEEVAAKFGEGPKTSLAASENAFYAVLDRLSAEAHCNFSGGSAVSIQGHFKLASQLLEQLNYRVAITKALAEDQLKNSHKALELLNGVVNADKFVYMWKAFLARGRVNQNLGLINEADADHKAVFKLRKSYAGADIPLRDEHRTKSVF